MWNESKLVNREEQLLQTVVGYVYERQQLDISVDMAAVNESTDELPQFTLVWDQWETEPMFAFNVTYNDGETVQLYFCVIGRVQYCVEG